MVAEAFGERQHHDLDGQGERRGLGHARQRGQRLLRYQVVTGGGRSQGVQRPWGGAGFVFGRANALILIIMIIIILIIIH